MLKFRRLRSCAAHNRIVYDKLKTVVDTIFLGMESRFKYWHGPYIYLNPCSLAALG